MMNRSTLLWVLGSAVALLAALVVGIDDNLPGIALLFLSAISFLVAFSHRWSETKWHLFLLVGSLIGFLISAVLHNALHALGGRVPAIEPVTKALHVAFFFIAVFFFPAGVLVGACGSFIAWSRHRKREHDAKLTP